MVEAVSKQTSSLEWSSFKRQFINGVQDLVKVTNGNPLIIIANGIGKLNKLIPNMFPMLNFMVAIDTRDPKMVLLITGVGTYKILIQ